MKAVDQHLHVVLFQGGSSFRYVNVILKCDQALIWAVYSLQFPFLSGEMFKEFSVITLLYREYYMGGAKIWILFSSGKKLFFLLAENEIDIFNPLCNSLFRLFAQTTV